MFYLTIIVHKEQLLFFLCGGTFDVFKINQAIDEHNMKDMFSENEHVLTITRDYFIPVNIVPINQQIQFFCNYRNFWNHSRVHSDKMRKKVYIVIRLCRKYAFIAKITNIFFYTKKINIILVLIY